ncbi:antitoxin Xre/MbcA/ParS toxin-binding domain-containing protein [Pseudomonas sp. BGr12]|uniref:MbcA/ParS/Xre antitoxin family protein n=1 Tax=Pseudomonas sp. BGr12 TaxID=2936269 RepID=UPI002559ACEC|nr:MbcA/ParS/Xre antitoxin family protein [Pseudomonas sp. BJa5]MDL2427665.1 MbcA/ParS/Xre antitoxin family protein [Pseudomonas sp. BJa5]
MNNLLERRFAARYPEMLLNQAGPRSNVFGFECLDGWADLIEGLLRLLKRYSDVNRQEIRISQAKEKFGQLRIYSSGGDEIVDRAIDIVELVSGGICECCGRPGRNSVFEGWMQTRCASHFGRPISDPIEPAGCDEEYANVFAGTLALLLGFFKSEAVHWVQRECRGLGWEKPAELLATTRGCKEVYTLLRRLELGVGI